MSPDDNEEDRNEEAASCLFMRRPDLNRLPSQMDFPEGCIWRQYTQGDLESLALLLGEAFEDSSWTPGKVMDELILPENITAYVVSYHSSVIATASARLSPVEFPGSGYLHWVAVSPKHRGMKLGTAVTVGVLNAFIGMGCVDAVLETQDFRIPAIKTYLKLGFQPEYRDGSHQPRWEVINLQLSNR